MSLDASLRTRRWRCRWWRTTAATASPVHYGDPLVLLTEHRCLSAWAGRLVFTHSLVHRKLKSEVACGTTTTTLIELATGRLVKEWPHDLWQRYLALADVDQASQREISR